MRLSVRPSVTVGVLSNRLNVESQNQRRTIAQRLHSFLMPKKPAADELSEIPVGHQQSGRQRHIALNSTIFTCVTIC